MATFIPIKHGVLLKHLNEYTNTRTVHSTKSFISAVQEEINVSSRTKSVCWWMQNMSKSAQRPASGDGERVDYTSGRRVSSKGEQICQHAEGYGSTARKLRVGLLQLKNDMRQNSGTNICVGFLHCQRRYFACELSVARKSAQSSIPDNISAPTLIL